MRLGRQVLTARDGEEAMQHVAESSPDLVLLDVVLPKKNGFQVCRQIKGSAPTKGIKVVMVTGKGQSSDRFWGMKQGADEYLTKPIAAEELAALVGRHLELRPCQISTPTRLGSSPPRRRCRGGPPRRRAILDRGGGHADRSPGRRGRPGIRSRSGLDAVPAGLARPGAGGGRVRSRHPLSGPHHARRAAGLDGDAVESAISGAGRRRRKTRSWNPPSCRRSRRRAPASPR